VFQPFELPADSAQARRLSLWMGGLYVALAGLWLGFSRYVLPYLAPEATGTLVARMLLDALFILGSGLLVTWLVHWIISLFLQHLDDSWAQRDRHYSQVRALFEASPLAIVMIDRQGCVLAWNRAAERMFGWKAEEVIGQPNPIVPTEQWQEFHELQQRILEGNTFMNLELRRQKRHGVPIDISLSAAPITDPSGNVTGIIGIHADVTEQKRHQEKIYHLAMHDTLTDLPNRRMLEEHLDRVLRALSDESRTTRGLLFILDLDNFKLLNDLHGQTGGDRYLVGLARHLQAHLDEGDILARLGGDEIALLATGAEPEKAERMAEGLRRAVRDLRHVHRGQTFQTTASIGGTALNGKIDSQTAIMRADSAMLVAKEEGKDRAVIHRLGERLEALDDKSQWGSRIKEALDHGRFILNFQPIIDLARQEAIYHEVLVRMRQEDGRLIGPTTFLPAAERFGLILHLDEYVLSAACDRLRDDPELRLFVNIAGSSLGEPRLMSLLEKRYDRDGLGPDRLVLEITETAAVRSFDRAAAWMEHLQALGCRFALDDFGVGFASFSCLRALPVDFVKIDGQIIKGMETTPTDTAWVNAMVAVGQAMGKQIVAEWIENEQSAERLAMLGVEYGQGNFWSAPRAEPAGIP